MDIYFLISLKKSLHACSLGTIFSNVQFFVRWQKRYVHIGWSWTEIEGSGFFFYLWTILLQLSCFYVLGAQVGGDPERPSLCTGGGLQGPHCVPYEGVSLSLDNIHTVSFCFVFCLRFLKTLQPNCSCQCI